MTRTAFSPRFPRTANVAESLARTPSRTRVSGRAGFTMVELLVVIAIIVLIIAILLPVFGQVRANARTATCLVNQRSIAHAMSGYTLDNAGRLPSPRTDNFSNAPGVGANTNHTWVKATSNGGGLVAGVETVKSLENGVIFPYMDKATKAYRSPNDPTDRVRSYSINAYVGNQVGPDDYNVDSSGFVQFPSGEVDLRTPTMSHIPQPSSTMCSIVEESTFGYNKEGWVIDWYTPYWIDLPAFWDAGRVSFSCMDGSTRTLNIFSDRFINEATALGGDYIEQTTNGAAWFAIRGFMLPGRCDLNDQP